jgi:O-antigen/teichoic acid export membrane protein
MQRLVTFFLVILGWAVFREDNWTTAMTLLNRLLIPHSGAGLVAESTLVAALLVCAVFAHFAPALGEIKFKWSWAPAVCMVALFVVCLAEIVGREPSKFLYFQF